MPNDSKNKKESNYESFEYFDELVSSYDQLDKESDECLDKVQALLEDAFCAQKKSLELRKEQYKVFELIQEWLEKCGCRYDCNYDNDECEELSERVNSVIEDLVDESEYGLTLINKALCQINEEKDISDELDYTFDEYTEYVDGTDEEFISYGVTTSSNTECSFDDK